MSNRSLNPIRIHFKPSLILNQPIKRTIQAYNTQHKKATPPVSVPNTHKPHKHPITHKKKHNPTSTTQGKRTHPHRRHRHQEKTHPQPRAKETSLPPHPSKQASKLTHRTSTPKLTTHQLTHTQAREPTAEKHTKTTSTPAYIILSLPPSTPTPPTPRISKHTRKISPTNSATQP